jgi:hypothetical protein
MRKCVTDALSKRLTGRNLSPEAFISQLESDLKLLDESLLEAKDTMKQNLYYNQRLNISLIKEALKRLESE